MLSVTGRVGVKYEVLTVKIMPEIMTDIDTFAQQMFPKVCPQCDGSGAIKRGECPKCDGAGQVGNRSDAVRYLLQFSLGQQASPEARAMAAVYGNVAPKLIAEMSGATHRLVDGFRAEILNAIDRSFPG